MAELTISTRTSEFKGDGASTNKITFTVYADYTISNSDTSATITSSLKFKLITSGQWRGVYYQSQESSVGRWQLNGDTVSPLRAPSSSSTGYTISTANKTATITKTHSAQNIPIQVKSLSYAYKCEYYSGGGASSLKLIIVNFSGAGTAYITIPAKTSYAVTYNANGGQNPPASQTKWYGETLTLSAAQPVKEGYTFKGWATSAENASAGTVSYAAGASYTGNAALTLYAVWELTYQKPTIYRLTVERCQSDGTLDDEGNYARVSFDWAVFRSAESRYYGGNTYPYADNSVETCTVTVGTQSATPTLTGASGHSSVIVGVGSYDVDTAYDATVSITDSQEISTDNTTTVSGSLAMAFFPLDYNADASAVGFFMPAPDNGSGAYFAKDVTIRSNLYIELDDNAGSGTDYEIIQALTDLGRSDLLS